MKETIKTVAKQIVPKKLLFSGWNQYCRFKSGKARQIFAQAAKTPAWLGWDDLERLQNAYPLPKMTYHYDDASNEQRGRERAKELLQLVPHDQPKLTRFLDLGSWDGMLCATLEENGKQAIGIDIRTDGLLDKARQSGARFLQMNIEKMGFADNSIDFAFSYNSFEHFLAPDVALAETLRVLRPGGYLYLNFGPMYLSPKGAHQFHVITVPYCQCLFPEPLLAAFAAEKKLQLTEFFWMNKWSVSDFRRLWAQYQTAVDTVFYYETYNASHMELITQYPSCFRSKTDDFDDLLVGYIELLFRKK